MIAPDVTNATSGIQYIISPLMADAEYGTKEIVEIDGKRPVSVNLSRRGEFWTDLKTGSACDGYANDGRSSGEAEAAITAADDSTATASSEAGTKPECRDGLVASEVTPVKPTDPPTPVDAPTYTPN